MRLFCLILLSCMGALAAQDNYALWLAYKDIALNTTSTGANVSGTVSGFPLLLRLTPANSDVFTQAAPGGADIRFAKPNGTHLPYQIERWDAFNQTAEIWVLMDTVLGNSNSQSLRMFWNKAGAVDSSRGSAVFSPANGYVGVWHLGNASGTNPRPNALAGGGASSPVNFPGAYTTPAGIIGLADTLSGGPGSTTAEAVPFIKVDSAGTNALYNFPNGTMSFSTWFYPVRVTFFARLFEMSSQATGTDRIWLGWNGLGSQLTWRYNSGSGSNQQNNPATSVSFNQWHQVTGVIGRNGATDTTRVYLDGNPIGSVGNAATPLPNVMRNHVFLGRSFETDNDSTFAGKLDEPQISNVVRSPSWIKLSYQNQQAVQTLATFGLSQAQAQVPGVPAAVTAAPGNSQVTVSWNAPSSDGGAAITGYTVLAVQDTTRSCSTAGLMTCNVTGLTNGAAYTFVVTASNSAGMGPASPPSALVTPATVPDAPTGLTDSAGNGQVIVAWLAPAFNGGSSVTRYVVTSVQDTARHCSTTGSLSCTVTGLTNGVAYSFRVTAENAAGMGAPSGVSAFATPVAPPGVSDPPNGVTATAGNAQATVFWGAPLSTGGSAITGYAVASNPDGKTCTTSGALTCAITALINGTAYTFTVVALNSVGPSAASVPSVAVTPAGVPGPPTSVLAAPGNAQVVVSWSTPAFNGGAAITGYTASSVQDTGKHCTTTGALTCAVSGLTNGLAYTFTVTAANAVGASASSLPSISVMPATVPGPPGNAKGTGGTSGQITVSWTSPSSTGGSPVTGYKVKALQDTSRQCSTNGALTCIVFGLTNSTAYTFTVAATNAIGVGTASEPSTPVTGILAFSRGMGIRLGRNSLLVSLPAISGSAQVSIIDLWGRVIWNKRVEAGTREVVWQRNLVVPGIYLVRLAIQEDARKLRIVTSSKVLLSR